MMLRSEFVFRRVSRLLRRLRFLGPAIFFALLLLTATHLAVAQAGEPPSDEMELKGIVLAKPDSTDGVGVWLVEGVDKGRQGKAVYTVYADSNTKFEPPPVHIQVNDPVKVEGRRTGDSNMQATELHGEKRRDAKRQVRGVVVARPDTADGIGTWSIRVGRNRVQTLVADANTRFDKGVPELKAWVKAKGTLQSDGSLLATRIRPDDYEANNVIVRLKDGVSPQELTKRHRLILVDSLLPSGNIHLYSTVGMKDRDKNNEENDEENDEENIVHMLKTQDADIVVWAELNYMGGIPEGNPYDIWEWGGQDGSSYENQEAFDQVHLPAPSPYTGQGITVAVVDTGVALDHPALSPHLASGWDMVDDDDVPNDEAGGAAWGHGTHIAGIIVHMAPESTILPVRVLNPEGRGNSFVVAYAIEWAVTQGASVINLSLGTDFDSRVLREVVDWATQQGVVVAAAAGNQQSTTPHYPAAYPNVVSVTGVDAANHKADFASYGEGWVDVAAPAVGITSTIVGDQGFGYASWSGTSMATAFVSGAAALERQREPAVSAAHMEEMLVATADDLDALNPSYAGQLGGGLLNVSRLLDLTEETRTAERTSSATPSSDLSLKLYLPRVEN